MLSYYSGVGSRATPPEVLQEMRTLGETLADQGWVLRSGGACGADQAFEAGASQVPGAQTEIFLPWRGFNGHTSPLYRIPDAATAIARSVHPAWHVLTQGARKLHARNSCQVLGADLQTPSTMVICWTPDGCENAAERQRSTGGTGTAIAIASMWGIPVFNLARPGSRARLHESLNDLIRYDSAACTK